MVAPVKPTVPTAPARTDPATFADRAAAMVDFFSTLVDYIAAANDFTEEQAQNALAAAIAGNLSMLNLSNLAGQLVGINTAGTALEGVDRPTSRAFATRAQAEGGTLETVLMNPLRTKQSVQEFATPGLYEFIHRETFSNTNGYTFASNRFDDTRYIEYLFVFDNLQPAAGGVGLKIGHSIDDGTTFVRRSLAQNIGVHVGAPGLNGKMMIYNTSATGGPTVFGYPALWSEGVDTTFFTVGPTRAILAEIGPVNTVRFYFGGVWATRTAFTSGSIAMYGLPRL